MLHLDLEVHVHQFLLFFSVAANTVNIESIRKRLKVIRKDNFMAHLINIVSSSLDSLVTGLAYVNFSGQRMGRVREGSLHVLIYAERNRAHVPDGRIGSKRTEFGSDRRIRLNRNVDGYQISQ